MAGEGDKATALWVLRHLRQAGFQALLACGNGFANGDTYKFSTFKSTATSGKANEIGTGEWAGVPDPP